MTDLDRLPMHYPDETSAVANGAKGAKPCRRHRWTHLVMAEGVSAGAVSGPWDGYVCDCGAVRDDMSASRRGRTNRSRGNRAELDVARSIPGGRKMGPLGLPWDVEVGDYARLQVKKLIHPPSPAEIARLIRAIPDTGDRLRGFVWVQAAGQGKRGKRSVWFLSAEFTQWHGADFGPNDVVLVTMPLATWVAEFVSGPA